jgi:hypothetical protein
VLLKVLEEMIDNSTAEDGHTQFQSSLEQLVREQNAKKKGRKPSELLE